MEHVGQHQDVLTLPSSSGRRLSSSPLVDFGRRRGLRERGWLCGRVELSQRRAQRIEPRGVGKSVVLYDAPDRRCYSGKLVVGEVNRRYGRPSPASE